MSFEPGDLVADAYDREGIVIERAKRPDPEWLEIQNLSEMRTHKDSQWWTLFPLGGGSVQMPEPLMRFLRKATREDFRLAEGNANDYAAGILRRIFGECGDR